LNFYSDPFFILGTADLPIRQPPVILYTKFSPGRHLNPLLPADALRAQKDLFRFILFFDPRAGPGIEIFQAVLSKDRAMLCHPQQATPRRNNRKYYS